MNLLENFSLKNHNTFGIDIKAKYFCEFTGIEEIKEILSNFRNQGLLKLILGAGSNILFTENYPGLILKNRINGIEIIEETDSWVKIKTGGGIIWDDLVKYSVDNDYWGIENLSIIPGTVGAAPIQNIGAYGCELKDVFESAEILNIKNLKLTNIGKRECEFGYRDSVFKHRYKNKFIVISIILKLSKIKNPNLSYHQLKDKFNSIPIDKIDIKKIREFIINTRNSKLPDIKKYGNAGSFFKNPTVTKEEFEKLKKEIPDIRYFELGDDLVKLSAANLIELCGLKGYAVGNCGTYNLHSLVIINNGNAVGKEILEFSNFIKKSVFNKFKIKLTEEVNII